MAYEVHLSKFDGPLDLLLHLIEKAQLDIKDIFVSEITAQYLAYMDEIDDLDLSSASEFLTMAATLIYIKSRQLLPRIPKEVDEDAEDEETRLIRQLREYKVYKQAGEDLQCLYESAVGAFKRLPEEIAFDEKEVSLTGISVEKLHDAFFALLHAKREVEVDVEENPLHSVKQDAFTVQTQLVHVRRTLREKGKVLFSTLFGDDSTRIEMVVTFMALLEMLVRNEISISQEGSFAPIEVQAQKLLPDEAYTQDMYES